MKSNDIFSLALVVATLFAGPATALDTPSATTLVSAADIANIGIGVSVGYQDLLALAPSAFPGPPVWNGTTDGAVLTAGLAYRNRLGSDSNWYFDGGLLYGTGSAKLEDTGTFPNVFKENLTAVYGNAGIGYVLPITKKTSIYGAGRLFYSSATSKWEDDTDEFESEPFKTFGYEPAIGCTHRLSPSLSYFGEFYSQFGWGSGEVGNVKYNTTVKNSCWRGGLLFHL